MDRDSVNRPADEEHGLFVCWLHHAYGLFFRVRVEVESGGAYRFGWNQTGMAFERWNLESCWHTTWALLKCWGVC
ncbi:hypothetical protein PAHAL_2G420900 [Panicum hallii]|jgi:hypothetical protein|uniref:Uncharacterized protein n=1 Tax=Panicum hallii TaxID=206008 RepID=A0A2T8KSE2_9POAL|nr:hypothetical protein PAHAL_2G420900 [Panicum hallii]